MIIAVTRDNSDLINQVCSTLKHDVQIMNGITNIKRFAICEMRNLNNYSNIIIDLTGLSDTEEDVIKAVLALKLMYNIRITIIAIGYEHGNGLLSKLFNEGIYNFVISKDKREQEKELYECIIGKGKQYKDSIKFRNIDKLSTKDNIVTKTEYKKAKQYITIAVAGTENHIGVTSQAIAITKFLNSLKLNACYIQANNKQDIETISAIFDIETKDGFFNYNEIDLYTKNKTINEIEYGYDFYIYDMGNFNEIADINVFLDKDVKIIVSGTKAWEQDNLMNVLDKLEKQKDIKYIFNFTSEVKKSEIATNMKKLGVKAIFSNYMPDPFFMDINENEYKEILSDCIIEKTIKTEILPNQHKKGILSNLRNKKSLFNKG